MPLNWICGWAKPLTGIFWALEVRTLSFKLHVLVCCRPPSPFQWNSHSLGPTDAPAVPVVKDRNRGSHGAGVGWCLFPLEEPEAQGRLLCKVLSWPRGEVMSQHISTSFNLLMQYVLGFMVQGNVLALTPCCRILVVLSCSWVALLVRERTTYVTVLVMSSPPVLFLKLSRVTQIIRANLLKVNWL